MPLGDSDGIPVSFKKIKNHKENIQEPDTYIKT